MKKSKFVQDQMLLRRFAHAKTFRHCVKGQSSTLAVEGLLHQWTRPREAHCVGSWLGRFDVESPFRTTLKTRLHREIAMTRECMFDENIFLFLFSHVARMLATSGITAM